MGTALIFALSSVPNSFIILGAWSSVPNSFISYAPTGLGVACQQYCLLFSSFANS